MNIHTQSQTYPANGFKELQKFILKDMKLQKNYQPIMIRTPLEADGYKSTKEVISRKIQESNIGKEHDFKNIPVYKVLVNNGIVNEVNSEFQLNIGILNEEERLQLILLCNWKIENESLQLEELIKAYDKNKNLFLSERPSSEEREKLRQDFVSKFPENKIKDMKIDEYVQGKLNTITRKPNKNTFCNKLENGLPGLGSIRGRTAKKFAIYFDRKSNAYYYNRQKYHSIGQAFDSLRNEIHDTIEAGKRSNPSPSVMNQI